jgi:hypothetical protein
VVGQRRALQRVREEVIALRIASRVGVDRVGLLSLFLLFLVLVQGPGLFFWKR